jgi:hypothetical protein
MKEWNRLQQEPGNWYSRFLIFRDMGPERTLLGAVHKAEKSRKKQSTRVPGAWNDASDKYQWKARAEAWDKHLQEEQEQRAAVLREIEAAEIERILTSDYARKEKRVAGLAKMAHVLENSFIDPDTQEINYKFLNPDKVREYRGCLDDIAKELGHRVKESRVTGKDGGPIEIITSWGGGQLEDNE